MKGYLFDNIVEPGERPDYCPVFGEDSKVFFSENINNFFVYEDKRIICSKEISPEEGAVLSYTYEEKAKLKNSTIPQDMQPGDAVYLVKRLFIYDFDLKRIGALKIPTGMIPEKLMVYNGILYALCDKAFNHGFNTTDVPKEFCLLYGEVAEAFDAWKQNRGLDLELADIAIYLLGLAEINGIDLGKAINEKMDINEPRTYEVGSDE